MPKKKRPRRNCANESKTLYLAVFAAVSLTALLVFFLSRNPPLFPPPADFTGESPGAPTAKPAAPLPPPAAETEKNSEAPGDGLANPLKLGKRAKLTAKEIEAVRGEIKQISDDTKD